MRTPTSICILLLCTHGSAAKAQAQKPPVIEVLTNDCTYDPGDFHRSCGTYLVNTDSMNRVVVTLTRKPGEGAGTLKVYNHKMQPVPLETQTRQVLMQAGERLKLPAGVNYEQGNSSGKSVTFSYTINGYYIPKPDLHQLPEGNAADYLRFVEYRIMPFDGTDACWDGNGPKPKVITLTALNLSFGKRIAIEFRNKRPHIDNSWRTEYIHPSNTSKGVGCVNDWPKYLEIKEVRYAF